MPFSAGRQHLDDQDRVFDELLPPLIGPTGHSQSGDVTAIAEIRAGNPSLGLGCTRPPGAQSSIELPCKPRAQDSVGARWRSHGDRKAVDQLVSRVGPVLPTEELFKGHSS